MIYAATVSPSVGRLEQSSWNSDKTGMPIAGCTAQPLSSGTATCTVTNLAAGGHWITTVYSGANGYLSSSFPGLTQTVNKKPAATTVSSSLDPSTVGQAVTYTATVSPAAATGTVAFEVGSVAIAGCTAQPVSSGTATCTVAHLAAGAYWVKATYSGDSSYLGSSSPGLTQTVNKKATTTTVSSSLDPSVVGQSVIYTATLNTTAATGVVAFEDEGVAISGCTAQPVSSGTATCTVTNTVAGAHWVKAAYSGDSSYLSSASSGLTQTVNKKTTTTTVSSSLDPSTVGQAVTYTATVSSATATGTVAFEVGSVAIAGCTAQPVSSGTATCTVAHLAAGAYWVKATYSGDSSYLGSSSPGLTQTVNKKAITTTVSSSLDPSVVGQSVIYTATLNTTAATGVVAFEDEGVAISGCTAQPVSSGTATCTVTNTVAGAHWLKAAYSGDSSYLGSASSGLTQTVNKKTTTTTVSSSLDPSTVGQAVTYTATVSSATATGTVAFDEAGTPITGCTAQPVSSGTATCTATNPPAGGHWIKAVYSGDNGYLNSTSSGLTQTVNKASTTTTLVSSKAPSIVGQPVTYTATVSPTAATGTVAFDEAGVPIAGCAGQTLNLGTATCVVPGYAIWSWYDVTASYSGDSNYLASASSTLAQTVEPALVEGEGPFRFFAPTSFWNTVVSADAPLDPSSAAVVGGLDEEVAAEATNEGGPSIATVDYSVPVYTVPADQPTVRVKLLNHPLHPTLQAAWEAVPLPPNAHPAAGTDKHFVVWQPSTDRLWEFWRLEGTSTGWQAEWGGAMEKVSSNRGVYGREAWRGAESLWGGDASSLSLAGGLITLEDLEDGVINHALAMAVPDVRAGVYASPAQRTDGYSDDPLSLPEGAHLRLDPNLDLASLHLPRFTLMIAEAAQRYGIFIRSSALSGGIVTLYGQDPTPTGTNPYPGHWGGGSRRLRF